MDVANFKCKRREPVSGLPFTGLFCALLLTGCVSTNPLTRVTDANYPGEEKAPWPEEYSQAISDALNPEADEIPNDLVRITRDNRKLTWRQFDDGDRVLMVSLVGDTRYYQDYVGRNYDTGSHYIWVSAVPELQLRCQNYHTDDLYLRLRQVMGLTPDTRLEAFLLFWVEPDSLFRPAPDNEITDATTGLDIPADTEDWYRKWFNELRSHQYFQSARPNNDAYPWTQLGYTYDWGPEHRGVSEFVIRTHSSVKIESITPIEEYCKPGSIPKT